MTNMTDVDDALARITETIKLHRIVLFMKGSLSRPQCGFSAAVVQTLAHYGVPYHAVDVLADPPVRQAIKTFSAWLTIPQLYVDDAFIGGCDSRIMTAPARSGRLAEPAGESTQTTSLMPTLAIRLMPTLRSVRLLTFLLPLIPALAACGQSQSQPQAAPPPPHVTIAKPTSKIIADQDEYVGRFVAVESVEVRARVAGYLDAIHFQARW